jgi:hypothetical protein
MANLPHVPTTLKNITKPGTNATPTKKEFANLLPAYLRTDTNRKVLSTILEFLISNGETRQFSQYHGRATGGYHKASQDQIASLLSTLQQNYSFSPGWFSKNQGTDEVYHALTTDDFFEVLKRYGVTSTDINEIFEHSAYTWSPPMDIDKFVNYDKYYWINWDLHIKFTTLDTSTIVGKRTATVGTVELQDGMRIKFDADTASFNAYSTSVIWIVSGVGNSITLEAMDTFTSAGKTKLGDNPESHNKEYQTIKHGNPNLNHWAISNYWAHENVVQVIETNIAWDNGTTYAINNIISYNGFFYKALQTTEGNNPGTQDAITYWKLVEKVLDSGKRANRPIVEMHNDVALYNYGTVFQGNVTYIVSGVASSSLIGNTNTTITINGEDLTLSDGVKLLFINSSLDINNNAYTLSGVGTSLVLGSPIFTTATDNYVFVNVGNNTADKADVWHNNGTTWIKSQQKITRGQAPLFKLYDDNWVELDDSTIYPNSNFAGSSIFSYKTDTSGTIDTELNLNPVLNTTGIQTPDLFASNNDYTFVWDQQATRYQYKEGSVTTKLAGLYHFKQGTVYKSGWSPCLYEAYTPRIKDVEVGNTIDDTNYAIVGSSGLAGSYKIPFINDSYLGDNFEVYAQFDGDRWRWFKNKHGRMIEIPPESSDTNPTIYMEGETVSTIYVKSETHGLEIVQPDGSAVPSGITNNGASTGELSFIVDEDTYPHLQYRSTVDNSIKGNIWLHKKATNYGNVEVYRNGTLQKAGTQVEAEAKTADYWRESTNVTFPYWVTEKSQGIDVTFDTTDGDVVIPSATSNQLLETTTIQEGDVINLSAYSPSNPNWQELQGDINPLVKNPLWDQPGDISYQQVFTHAKTLIQNQPFLSGDALGNNNYRNIRVLDTVPGTILQYKNPALLTGFLLDNDLVQSVIWYAQQYEIFKFKLINEIQNQHQLKDYTTLASRQLLDDALMSLAQGKATGFPFSITNHISYKFVSDNEKFHVGDGTTTAFALPSTFTTWTTADGYNDNVEIYVSNVLKVLDTDYTCVGNGTITFLTAPINGAVILTRIAKASSNDSFIPNSPASLSLNKLYIPQIISDSTGQPTHVLKMNAMDNGSKTINVHDNFKHFIQGHDGSLYPVSSTTLTIAEQALMDFEMRIYNHTLSFHKFEDSFHTGIQKKELNNKFTRYNQSKEIRKELYNIWEKLFNVQPFTFTFDTASNFTINYSGIANQPGHALGIIKDKFLTGRPDLYPWKIFAWTDKPTWWDTYYCWKNTANGGDDTKRANLITAIKKGHWNNPADIGRYDARYEINTTITDNIVAVTGNLNDPVAAGLISAGELASLTNGNKQTSFEYEDYGPAEQAFENSSFSKFVDVLQYCFSYPNEYINRYFDSLKFKKLAKNINTVDTDGGRTAFNSYITHGEVTSDNVITKKIGLQNFIFEFLLAQDKDNTIFGKTLRNLTPEILCKTNNFIINNRTAIKLPVSFNLQAGNTLPEENQQIFLYEGPANERFVYSNIKITKKDTGLAISTYDSIGKKIIFHQYQSDVKSLESVSDSKIANKTYSTTEVTIDSGKIYENNQAIVDVLRGIYHYYTAKGITTDKTIKDIVQSYVIWGEQNQTTGASITIYFSSKAVTIEKARGTVLLDKDFGYQNINGFTTTGKIVHDKTLEVSRTGNDFKIVHDNAGMGCLFFKVIMYEHVIAIDKNTIFNDVVYSPLLGIKQPRAKLSTVGLLDWTGRLAEPGYMIKSNTIEANIDTSIKQISTDYFAVEQGIPNQELTKALRYNVGYTEKNFLRNLNTDNDVSFEFYRGYIQNKGTNENFNRLERNINTLYNDSNSITSVNEEWMIKETDFGATRESDTIEFVVQPRDFNQERQLIEFSKFRDETNKDLKADTKINILGQDSRWVWKPKGLDTSLETIRVTTVPLGTSNAFALDGIRRKVQRLVQGITYRFDLSDSSNDNHHLYFSTSVDGTWQGGTRYDVNARYYLDGVQVADALVWAASYKTSTTRWVEITVVSGTGNRLFYFCSEHANMGATFILCDNEYGYNTDIFYDRAKYKVGGDYITSAAGAPFEGDLPYGGYALISEADHFILNLTELSTIYDSIELTQHKEWVATENYGMGCKVRYKGKLWEAQQGVISYEAKTIYVNGADQSGDTIFVDGLTQKPYVGTKLTWTGADADGTVPTETHVVEEVESWDASAGTAALVIYPAKVTKSSDNAAITVNMPPPALWLVDGTGYDGFYLDEPTWLAQEDTLGKSRVWVANYDLNGWNMLQLMDYDNTTFTSQTTTATLEPANAIIEVCKGIVTGDEAQITTKGVHNLIKGEYVVIAGITTANTNLNGIHKIIGFPTGNNVDGSLKSTNHFLIDEFVGSTVIATEGKFYTFKPVRFQTVTELTATTSDPSYFWRQGSVAYVDYDAIYGGWAVYRHDMLHALDVFLMYDADNYQEAVNNCYGWGLLPDNTLGQPVLRWQQPKVDEANIDKIILYNGDTNKKIVECELYDPFKGVIPGEADKNIDYKSLYDPAMYSNSTDASYSTDCGQGSSIIDTTRAWANENEGLIWWNLNTVKYIEYEQNSISYRNDYWGKVFPASTIDVYEWTKSPIDPEAWVATTEGTIKDEIEISGTPYFVTSGSNTYYYYTIEDEIDATGTLKNYYYFWVKNKTYAVNQNKTLSTYDIARYISDPTAMGVNWAAPIAPNAITIANVQNLIETNTVVQIRMNTTDKAVHDEWVTIIENDSSKKLNEKYRAQLVDNLIGFNTDYTEHKIWTYKTDYIATARYVIGDIIMFESKYWKVLKPHFGGNTTTAVAAGNLVDAGSFLNGDIIYYDSVYFECTITHAPSDSPATPGQSTAGLQLPFGVWQTPWVTKVDGHQYYNLPDSNEFNINPWTQVYDLEDIDVTVIPADTINPIFKKKQKRLSLPDYNLHPYARQGNLIRPRQSWFENRKEAKREFVKRANLILKDINVVDEMPEWSSSSSSTVTLDMQKSIVTHGTVTYNPTTYWQYVDWIKSGVKFQSSATTIADLSILNTLDASTRSLNEIIEVTDNGTGNKEYYQVQKVGDSQKFVLIKKENGTIELLDTLWETIVVGYDVDLFDFVGFDSDAEVEFEIIASDVLFKLFTDTYESKFNNIFFNMLRYILHEQSFVPWIQKTSESNFRLVSKGDIQPGGYNVENVENTIDYYNEAKPYHSKLEKQLFSKHMFDMNNSTLTEIDSRTATYGNSLSHVAKMQIQQSNVDAYLYEYTMTTATDHVIIPANEFPSTLNGTTISWNPGSVVFKITVNNIEKHTSTYTVQYGPLGRVVNFTSKLAINDIVRVLFTVVTKESAGVMNPEGTDVSTNDMDLIYSGGAFTDASFGTSILGPVMAAYSSVANPNNIISGSNFYIPYGEQNWNNEMVPQFLRESVVINIQNNPADATEVLSGSPATRSWRTIIGDRDNHAKWIQIDDSAGSTLSSAIVATDTEIDVVSASTIEDPAYISGGTIIPIAWKVGRVWIGAECIEFDGIDGNTLKSCHRGALGTSPADHDAGTVVRDATKEINVNRYCHENITSGDTYRDRGFPRHPQWNDLNTILDSSTNEIATKIKDSIGTI